MLRRENVQVVHRASSKLVVLAATLSLTACNIGAPGSSSDVGSMGDAVTGPGFGVDYSWARPSPASLRASGYGFVARYLSNVPGKNLSKSEADALTAAGIDVVCNWEQNADDVLGGYARGVEDATAAESQALADGMPAGRPIYFSIDFDAQPSQEGVIDAYFDGVAAVIGRGRAGAYGGYGVIKRLFDDGKITWGWQTYAWSYGQWDPRAQVRQIQNGIDGGAMDLDQSVAADFGQWGPGAPTDASPTPNYPYRAIARDATGDGYWILGSDGGVFTYGDAGFDGSMGGKKLTAPTVAMAATPDGKGYWLAGSDGGVFAFGDAGFFGSMGGTKLNAPIVGVAATPTGKGYWLVASDGGVFAFGDAGFLGSMGGKKLNAPVVGVAAAPTGQGYWLVASDGGIFAFGDAGFHGSMGGKKLNAPVLGMSATPNGGGYWLIAGDGGIFAFGNAGFYGSRG